jgi:hypothetical protein
MGIRLKIVLALLGLAAVLAAIGLTAISYRQNTNAPAMTKADDVATTTQQAINSQGILLPSTAERSLDRANQTYLVMIALTSLFGAMGFIASAAIYYYSKQVSTEQSAQVRDLQGQVARSGERAAEAGAIAGRANERAAILEKEAAQAKLEAEQLKQSLGWRYIEDDVSEKIVNELKKTPGNVHVAWSAGDSESFFFKLQVAKVFRLAGWKVTEQGVMVVDRLLLGIAVPKEPSGLNSPIRLALESAGWFVESYDFPPPGMVWGPNATTGEALIFIGLRPTVLVTPARPSPANQPSAAPAPSSLP